MKLEEIDVYIEEKATELNNIYENYEGMTRKLAELSFEIDKESQKKFKEKSEKVIREIIKVSKFVQKLSYVRSLKYIPERIYPQLKQLKKDIKPPEYCEKIGYSKFLDIAKLGKESDRMAILSLIFEGKIKTAREIRAAIKAIMPKEDEEEEENTTNKISEYFPEMVRIDWKKKTITFSKIEKTEWEKTIKKEFS